MNIGDSKNEYAKISTDETEEATDNKSNNSFNINKRRKNFSNYCKYRLIYLIAIFTILTLFLMLLMYILYFVNKYVKKVPLNYYNKLILEKNEQNKNLTSNKEIMELISTIYVDEDVDTYKPEEVEGYPNDTDICNQRKNNKVNQLRKKEIIKKRFDPYIKTTSDIPILMAGNSEYVYMMMVTITSGCLNQFKHTQLSYKIMVGGDFSEDASKILYSIPDKFPHCSVEIINMENEFKNISGGKWGIPTLYRLRAASKLPNINKILFLDGDVLVYSDLNELYNIDMNNLYFRGYPEYLMKHNLFTKLPVYVCCGVLLMNLKLIREDNLEKQFIEILNKYKEINYPDQTIINYVARNKIDILPVQYGVYALSSEKRVRYKWNKLYNIKKPPIEQFVYGWYHPKIIHFSSGKKADKICPTGNNLCKKRYILSNKITWWEYAEITDYYDLFINKACKK